MIDRADAFVVVTPEYHHGCPASLKQAIDLATTERYAEPVGFVAGAEAAAKILLEWRSAALRNAVPDVA